MKRPWLVDDPRKITINYVYVSTTVKSGIKPEFKEQKQNQ
jgi:hypothetical protein